jgi:hypothetical protein
MVINKNSKSISYDAMMKSQNLNSFFDDNEASKDVDEDEATAEEE